MSGPTSEPTLRLLILCEDEPALRRAAATVAHLQRELLNRVLLHLSFWRFRWLHHPKMLRMAAIEAEKADIVLVFRCANQEPTESVKACFLAWMNGRTADRRGLLAVHETTTNLHHPTRWSLCPTVSGGIEEHDEDGGSRFMNQATE